MKRISIVSLASFVFLMLSSVVALVTKSIFTDAVYALAAGCITLIVSGVLALIIRENVTVNVVCFFISSVAMGMLIRSWYILRGLENGIFTMLLISLSLVAYLWLYFAISRIPFIRGSRTGMIIFSAVFVVLSVVAYIILVNKTETTYLSTLGYFAIIELGFIFAMSLEARTREDLIRNLTLSTYSVFVVAIIVAVFVIIAALGGDGLDCDCDCGGDCCDCGDPGLDFSGSKKKKRDRL